MVATEAFRHAEPLSGEHPDDPRCGQCMFAKLHRSKRTAAIDCAGVEAEIERLRLLWSGRLDDGDDILSGLLDETRLGQLDLFDRVQLAEVVRVCQDSASLSEAGRKLFSASRQQRISTNDADRLRKYLARFELTWAEIANAAGR